MEEDLRKILSTGLIGKELLDPDTQLLLREVEGLRSNSDVAKEKLQSAQAAKLLQENNVEHAREMLFTIQDLCRLYKREVETDGRVEKTIHGELRSHLTFVSREEQQLEASKNTIEEMTNELHSREREFDDLQQGLTLDSDLLQELLDHLSVKEEEHLILLHYSANEASKIKKLGVTLERLSEEVASEECRYRETQHDAKARENVRTQLVATFLKEAQRRDDLLLQWESTLEALTGKGGEEALVYEELFRLQNQTSTLRHTRNRNVELLNNLKSSITEAEVLVEGSSRESKATHLSYLALLEAIRNIRAETAGLQSCNDSLTKDIERTNDQILETKSLYDEKKTFLERLENECEKLENDLAMEEHMLITSEESIRMLQRIRTERDCQCDRLEKQIERVRCIRERHNAEICNMNDEEQLINGEIGAFKNSKSRCLRDMKETNLRRYKCDQMIYNQNMSIQNLKERIHNLTHDDNNNPLTEEQKSNIAILKEKLQQTHKSSFFLNRAISILKTRHLRSEVECSDKNRDTQRLEDELSSLKTICETTERNRLKTVREKEEIQVDVSLTQLHLQNRMNKINEVKDAYRRSVEQRRDMEELLSEQCRAVEGSLEATKTQIRDMENRQMSQAKILHGNVTKIEHITEKFNRIKATVCTSDDENEDEVSPIGVIVKLGKERSGLQEAGDILDGEVRRAEEELEAIQELVSFITKEEDTFRSKLHHATTHNKEDEERADLDDSLKALERDVECTKQNISQETTSLKGSREHLREVELQVHAVEDLLREKGIHTHAVDREIADQFVKTRHAAQAVSLVRAKLKGKKGRKLVESDISLRVTQERLRIVNTLLGEVVSSQPDIANACALYCQQEKIPPPKSASLVRKGEFGSRSSIGTLHSARGSDASGASPLLQTRRSLHSSRLSINSQDSGSSSVAGIDGNENLPGETPISRRRLSVATSNPVHSVRSGSLSVIPTPKKIIAGDAQIMTFSQKKKNAGSPKKKKGQGRNIDDSPKDEPLVQINQIQPEFPGHPRCQNVSKGQKVLKRPSLRI